MKGLHFCSWPDQREDEKNLSWPETNERHGLTFTRVNKRFLHVKENATGKQCAVIDPPSHGFAGVTVCRYRVVPLSDNLGTRFVNACGAIDLRTDVPFNVATQGNVFLQNIRSYLATHDYRVFGDSILMLDSTVDVDQEAISFKLSCCHMIFEYRKEQILTEKELYAAATFDMACVAWFLNLQKRNEKVYSFGTGNYSDGLTFMKVAVFGGHAEFEISLKKEQNGQNPFWNAETGTLHVSLIESIISRVYLPLEMSLTIMGRPIVVPPVQKILLEARENENEFVPFF